MRQDVYIENDSGGMSILSSSVVDRAIAGARGNDASFAAAHEAILVLLEGDDSFIARVVANEPLTEEEEEQWVCRIRTRLKVPCGRLLVCAGFDPRSLEDFKEHGPHDSAREVHVPPGEYRVDVYTHAPTMTARILRERWDEKIGAWFRREHKGKSFPSWLAGELARFAEENDEDPGHEKEWGALKASVASKKLRIETSTLDWVGYVIHLHARDGAALSEPTDGWFKTDTDFRKPARFPMGLPAVGAEDPEYRYALEPILPRQPKPTPAAPPPESAAPVLKSLGEPVPIDGGAVVVPAERIGHVARIAWFCDREVDAAAIVTLPPGVNWAPKVKADTPAIVSTAGNRVEVGFPATEAALLFTLPWTVDLCRSLRRLPDGAVLDLCFANTGSPEATSGNHRWRGTVNTGRWSITHVFPAVTRAAVEEALALVDELDRGKGIRARDAAEADSLMQGAPRDDFLSGVKVVRRGLVLTTAKKAGAHLPYIARYVFRRRLRGAWDLSSDEAQSAELQQIFDDAVAALTKAATPAVAAFVAAQATGTFRQADLSRWQGVDRKRLNDFDARFRSIGLQPLGDIVFEFAPEVAVRAYGAEGATVYGSLMWPKEGEPQVDLFTRFSDGSSVTTTTTPGMQDVEAAKIFRSSFPGQPVDVLWQRHRVAVGRRLSTGCSALPAEATVKAFTQAVGDFFERQRAAMRR